MKTSRRGRAFIQRHEGLRLTAYKADPSEQFWTIGYGHYGSKVRQGEHISISRAKAYLKSDLHRFERAVGKVLLDDALQREFDALVSFAFNLGEAVVTDTTFSTLARRLRGAEARSYQGRCRIYRSELPKWVNAGGRPLPGLVTRRADEVRLATEGRYK